MPATLKKPKPKVVIGNPPKTKPARTTMNREHLDALLSSMIHHSEGVSDLFFMPGEPPHVEIYGELTPMKIIAATSGLTVSQIEAMYELMAGDNERLRVEYAQNGSCDFSYATAMARFRVNYFRQHGQPSLVMRKLQSEIPTLQQLALPPIFSEIVKERHGIVFVTGGTGTGKTTTLAALINEINETRAHHVITLEDPIEFVHTRKRAIISQRELGRDFQEFSGGLRAALRQAPKVILVGEIRDRATMEIAMTASETGHLVFATLHTINAGQTVNRILGMFNREEEPLIRQRLAATLRYVISQRLVEKKGGGRQLITEVMGANLSTREAILYGEKEGRGFEDIIESASSYGWHTFDHQLLAASQAGLIDVETAKLHATQKSKVTRDLDGMRNNPPTTPTHNTPPPISGLRLEVDPFTRPPSRSR